MDTGFLKCSGNRYYEADIHPPFTIHAVIDYQTTAGLMDISIEGSHVVASSKGHLACFDINSTSLL